MNKTLNFLLLAAAAAMFAQTASAAIPDEAVALGPVAPGMTAAALVSACGEPQAKNGDEWSYPAFRVEFDDDGTDAIEEVGTRSPEIATPAGVRVGQPESALAAAYGEPDKRERDDGGIEVEYRAAGGKKKLEAKIAGGVIVGMDCSLDD